MNQTREYLRLLSVFHYVVGGIGYLVSLFPIIHLAMGLMILLTPKVAPPEIVAFSSDGEKVIRQEIEVDSETVTEESTDSPDTVNSVQSEARSGAKPKESIDSPFQPIPDETAARAVGGLFVGISSVFILLGFILSTLVIIAGRRLAAYRSHTFCLVMAAIECLFLPFGTVLGVLSIIVLLKPEARELFGLPALDDPPVQA